MHAAAGGPAGRRWSATRSCPQAAQPLPPALGPPRASTRRSPTAAPVSLYGATKLASEALALEYGEAFGLPVFVNRCGILAGAGQFGRPDQGIFAYWINSRLRRRPLRYLGFGGKGHQVRDCLHPNDLVPLLGAQMAAPKLEASDRIVNIGGGMASAMSLLQLTEWCDDRFGPNLSPRMRLPAPSTSPGSSSTRRRPRASGDGRRRRPSWPSWRRSRRTPGPIPTGWNSRRHFDG